MSNRKISNAIIRDVRLGQEMDLRFWTAYVDLDLGSATQSFGNYNLDDPYMLGKFVQEVIAVVGSETWNGLKGKPCRIDHDYTRIYMIGHFMEDKWFDPEAVFNASTSSH